MQMRLVKENDKQRKLSEARCSKMYFEILSFLTSLPKTQAANLTLLQYGMINPQSAVMPQ